MVKKILFYTDCEVFGGSERMLPILINDKNIREEFEISFAFRGSENYENGFYDNSFMSVPVCENHRNDMEKE